METLVRNCLAGILMPIGNFQTRDLTVATKSNCSLSRLLFSIWIHPAENGQH